MSLSSINWAIGLSYDFEFTSEVAIQMKEKVSQKISGFLLA